ncbi:uncharacterized protein LOC135437598 [Drosophila montana]|uniref:uncharacterized protein LOC135437598 n=1 Tax=Drosophila montana TaxID=40370 RepID=UPI00313ED1EF
MWQGFGIYMALLLCLASAQAAIIRSEQQQETTTIFDGLAEAASTTVAPEESTTHKAALNRVALSRDQDASVQIGLASVDPAPGTIEGDLIVVGGKPQMKSAKLLLLSTPAKRPAEVEQQLEEQDESDTAAAGSAESGVPTTTLTYMQELEGTTTAENSESTTTAAPIESSDRQITKLFPINATISSQDSSEPNVAIALATDNATIAIAEQPQAAGDNNVAIELALVEPEAEYVLLDVNANAGLQLAPSIPASTATHDELQLGSFTHIDSDAHLQPVVHSVEIVPTRFDDPLIVNYVHNLR